MRNELGMPIKTTINEIDENAAKRQRRIIFNYSCRIVFFYETPDATGMHFPCDFVAGDSLLMIVDFQNDEWIDVVWNEMAAQIAAELVTIESIPALSLPSGERQ